MKVERLVRRAVLLAVPVVLILLPQLTPGGDSVMLITPDEAAMPDARAVSEELNNGPIIDIESPENGSTLSGTFRLAVDVAKKPGGAAVAMDTLKISYLKVVSIDITERVKKYVKGTRLDVPDAEFPVGNHRALIYIEDVDGNVSSKLFRVKVVKTE